MVKAKTVSQHTFLKKLAKEKEISCPFNVF